MKKHAHSTPLPISAMLFLRIFVCAYESYLPFFLLQLLFLLFKYPLCVQIKEITLTPLAIISENYKNNFIC